MSGLIMLFGSLKSKFFNLTTIFLGIMVLIIGVFLISNSDTVLSRFGFETKTNLKAEVTSVKKDLDAVLLANADQEEVAADEKVITDVKIALVEQVMVVKAKTSVKVEESKASVRTSTKTTVEKIKKENPPEAKVITIDKADSDRVSEEVIVSLNSVYDELFPTQSDV